MNHFFSNNSLLSLSKEPKILTWDASGSAPLDDGTGSWNFSGGTNWLYGSYYGSWIADSVAVFGVNNGTAGIIILDGLQPIPVKKIIFNSAGSGNYTLSGGTINLRGTNPTIENNVGATINSTLDGSNGLIKSGSGTLTLSGLNTYIGVTYIYAGSITFDSFGVSATTSEFNISSGANLRFNIGLARQINTRITGDGSLIKGSSGELVLTNGLNNYSGGTTVVDNGRLTITTNGCLGSGPLNLQSSRTDATTTFMMNGSQTINNVINIDTTNGRNNLESKNGNVTITGNIVVTGSSTNAVVYLSNTSGYNLTISGNISGTTTSTQSFRGAIGSTGTISGTVNIPNGVFNVDSNGSWTINSSGHTYLSTFFLNNGKFILGINNALCTTARLVWGGTSATNYGICDLNGYNQTVTGLESTLTVNGKITNNSLSSNSILTLSGLPTNYTYNSTITDGTSRNIALVMNSAGRTQNLGGNNTYSGGTNITAGTLKAGVINAFGTGTITISAGATLDMNFLNLPNTIVNNSGSVINRPSNLLLHFDNNFNDSSTNNLTVSAINGAATSVTQSKFGGYSLFVNGGYARINSASSLAFSTNNFTIDAYIYIPVLNSGTGSHTIFSHRTSDNISSGVLLCVNPTSGDLYCFIANNSGGWQIVGQSLGHTITANTWHHIALVRNGNNVVAYLNGIAGSTIVISGAIGATGPFNIGCGSDKVNYSPIYGIQDFNGYIDEFRIINGKAIYTANFTPQPLPF